MAEAADAPQSFPGAFCEACNKWRRPDGLLPDGSCPRCGTVLEPVVPPSASAEAGLAAVPGRVEGGEVSAGPSVVAQPDKIPWHFWLMVAATVVYLGWRVIQGLQALF